MMCLFGNFRRCSGFTCAYEILKLALVARRTRVGCSAGGIRGFKQGLYRDWGVFGIWFASVEM